MSKHNIMKFQNIWIKRNSCKFPRVKWKGAQESGGEFSKDLKSVWHPVSHEKHWMAAKY